MSKRLINSVNNYRQASGAATMVEGLVIVILASTIGIVALTTMVDFTYSSLRSENYQERSDSLEAAFGFNAARLPATNSDDLGVGSRIELPDSYRQAVQKDSPVVYYPFDESSCGSGGCQGTTITNAAASPPPLGDGGINSLNGQLYKVTGSSGGGLLGSQSLLSQHFANAPGNRTNISNNYSLEFTPRGASSYNSPSGYVRSAAAGSTWTPRQASEASGWKSVAYGKGIFVAVSTSGTNRVMTSPNGEVWTARTVPSSLVDNHWLDVTYGNGIFVAVSNSGTDRVMTSPDGITWTARSAAENNSWSSVTYGNGTFVAVSSNGTNRVMTSPDGINWTARSAAGASSWDPWSSVTYGNGIFVAISVNYGTNVVMTSPDGKTWTMRSAATAGEWRSVTYGNGTFVAVASGGTNRVMTSPNGITWTARSAPEANQWWSVTYGNGTFVAVSIDGTKRVMTSPDGITWSASPAAEANPWRGVTYGNGTFVAVAYDGSNRVMTSGGGRPENFNLTENSFAIELWAETNPNAHLVARAVEGGARSYRLFFNANNQLSLMGGNGLLLATSREAIPNGYHHLVVSGDSSGVKIFVDGREVAINTPDGNNASFGDIGNNGLLQISGDPSGSGPGSADYINGIIDEFALYRQPLSAERIEAHYRAADAASKVADDSSGSNVTPPSLAGDQMVFVSQGVCYRILHEESSQELVLASYTPSSGDNSCQRIVPTRGPNQDSGASSDPVLDLTGTPSFNYQVLAAGVEQIDSSTPVLSYYDQQGQLINVDDEGNSGSNNTIYDRLEYGAIGAVEVRAKISGEEEGGVFAQQSQVPGKEFSQRYQLGLLCPIN